MKFVDFHTHIYPEKIAVRATASLSKVFNKPENWPGTGENLEIFGKAAGITKFVILPVALKASQVHGINEFAIAQAQEYPDFVPFGTLHVEQDDMIGEIDYLLENGFKGIKLHPDQQGYTIDDKRMFECYDYASQKGFPILFHCGDTDSDFSHPSRTKKIIQEFPHLKMIAAHFGGWKIYDEAYDILRMENIHFDMSSSMYLMGTEKTARFIKDYGAEKIFFGTDFPLCDPSEEVQKFLSLNISDDEKEMVAYKNASDFLGLNL